MAYELMIEDDFGFYRIVLLEGQPEQIENMSWIEGSSFAMGDHFGLNADEMPVHEVFVSAFYIAEHETSKAVWDEVYDWAMENGYQFDHSGSWKAPDHPVHTVNWYDAVKWCNARSEMLGLTPAYYESGCGSRSIGMGDWIWETIA